MRIWINPDQSIRTYAVWIYSIVESKFSLAENPGDVTYILFDAHMYFFYCISTSYCLTMFGWSPPCLGDAENQVFGLKGWVNHMEANNESSARHHVCAHIFWVKLYIYIRFMTESPCWHTCSIIFAVVCAIECDIPRAPVIVQRLLLGILERLELLMGTWPSWTSRNGGNLTTRCWYWAYDYWILLVILYMLILITKAQ